MCHAHSSPKLFYWTCSYWNFSRKLLFCISIADYHASQPRVHLKMYALGKLELVFIETICWDTSNILIPLVNHNPAIFSFPQALKNVKSPTKAEKFESPDNSNMFHMFNNDTYTDFRNTSQFQTAYKHISVRSYAIQVI